VSSALAFSAAASCFALATLASDAACSFFLASSTLAATLADSSFLV